MTKSKTKRLREEISGRPYTITATLVQILDEEWAKRRPPIPMGQRRIELAIACMRRAYDAGVAAEP